MTKDVQTQHTDTTREPTLFAVSGETIYRAFRKYEKDIADRISKTTWELVAAELSGTCSSVAAHDEAILEAKRRAAIAVLTKIETTAQRFGDNHHEIRQLSKAYREIVGLGRNEESITSELGTTIEAPELNHVAALEHFYDCMRFDAHLPPRVGPVSYDDVQQCLVAARDKLNESNGDLLAANLKAGDLERVTQNLRNELQAANEEVASLRGQLVEAKRIGEENAESTRSLLAIHDILGRHGFNDYTRVLDGVRGVIESLDEARRGANRRQNIIDEIRSLLAKDGFNSDNLPQLVETALESLREAQKERDGATAQIAVWRAQLLTAFPNAAESADPIGTVIDACNKIRTSGEMLIAHNVQVTQERDVLRSTILDVQDALATMGFDATRPPNSGNKADTVKAVESVVAQCKDLAKRLDATRGALHIANSQLAVANSNLTNALKLQQIAPDALTPFMRVAAKIISFWRRGDESYQLAANELERALESAIGDAWAKFKSKQGPIERGAMTGVVMNARREDHVQPGAIAVSANQIANQHDAVRFCCGTCERRYTVARDEVAARQMRVKCANCGSTLEVSVHGAVVIAERAEQPIMTTDEIGAIATISGDHVTVPPMGVPKP